MSYNWTSLQRPKKSNPVIQWNQIIVLICCWMDWGKTLLQNLLLKIDFLDFLLIQNFLLLKWINTFTGKDNSTSWVNYGLDNLWECWLMESWRPEQTSSLTCWQLPLLHSLHLEWEYGLTMLCSAAERTTKRKINSFQYNLCLIAWCTLPLWINYFLFCWVSLEWTAMCYPWKFECHEVSQAL